MVRVALVVAIVVRLSRSQSAWWNLPFGSGVHLSIESLYSATADCPVYHNSSFVALTEKARRHLESPRNAPVTTEPLSYLYERISDYSCAFDKQLEGREGFFSRVAMEERAYPMLAAAAKKRILAKFRIGEGDADVTFFVLTLPKRLCLARNVVRQLEEGGASGLVVLVKGHQVNKRECIGFLGEYITCNHTAVVSQSYAFSLLPLAYDDEIGGELNIFFEDDAALCATPDDLIVQARRAPGTWLGYTGSWRPWWSPREAFLWGAQTWSIWRQAAPFVSTAIRYVLNGHFDLFVLHNCLHVPTAPFSMVSTFSHLEHQRDQNQAAVITEFGHNWACSKWLDPLHPKVNPRLNGPLVHIHPEEKDHAS